MSSTFKVAVVGIGSLGKEHARIYADLAAQHQVEFAGVYDRVPEAARRVADKLRVRTFATVAEAAAASDALSIVTPTTTHFELAPNAAPTRQASARRKADDGQRGAGGRTGPTGATIRLRLQVGHVERFNPVFRYLETVATAPRFIEAHRLSPYPARSTDIGVVLDLMIHDLDVVLAFVKSPVTSVDAVGIPVLSQTEDIANARLRFANGCVANLTASRVSPERMRKIRVFSGGATTSYVSLDYRAQEGFIYRIAREGEEESSLFKKLLAAKNSVIVSEFGGNGLCASRCLWRRTSRSNWSCKASSSVCAPIRLRWSAANRPNARSIWRLKSRGKSMKRRAARETVYETQELHAHRR